LNPAEQAITAAQMSIYSNNMDAEREDQDEDESVGEASDQQVTSTSTANQ
jgi:hypothetical protein